MCSEYIVESCPIPVWYTDINKLKHNPNLRSVGIILLSNTANERHELRVYLDDTNTDFIKICSGKYDYCYCEMSKIINIMKTNKIWSKGKVNE